MDIIVAERHIHGATVVALHGELGIDAADRLRATLGDLVDGSAARIVIDLAPVTFCDSIGLSAFVDGHNRCTRAGGYLRLAAATPFLRRVLSVVGLLGQVPLYDTVEAACAGDVTRRSAPVDGIPHQRPQAGPGMGYL